MHKAYVVVNRKGEWISGVFRSPKAAHEFWIRHSINMSDDEREMWDAGCVIEVTICV